VQPYRASERGAAAHARARWPADRRAARRQALERTRAAGARAKGCSHHRAVHSAAGLRTMKIDWDVPIRMDDGLELRADVYRPDERPDAGKHPVILSYGP